MAASVSSLDQDMKKLRMSRYTPQAANEIKSWIEEALGDSIGSGDLLDALKDGTILCRLANLVLPSPGVKFKKSNMPFMQMENISHFLRACEMSPLNLPAHDRFLTVDLYEQKDPAQVLQCLGAFSRAAHSLRPNLPEPIGPKRAAAISPSNTGLNGRTNTASGRTLTPSITGGSNSSKATENSIKSPVSSWSQRRDEGVTAPAWNIHQYGYMGGANQGSQGVAFGARRQITSAAPQVPSLAEKERMRREKAEEEERQRRDADNAQARRRADQEAEEQRARDEEERQWQEQTNRQRDEEKARMDQQRREWEEQERRWKADEEARLQEEQEMQQQLRQASVRRPPGADRNESSSTLKGQYLSQYQAEQKSRSRQPSYNNDPQRQTEKDRVADLERQLEEAKEREKKYLQEREEKFSGPAQNRSTAREDARPVSPPESNVSWAADEREFLRSKHTEHQQQRALPSASAFAARPLPEPTARPVPETPPSLPTRREPEIQPTIENDEEPAPSLPSRPLPDPRLLGSSSPLPAPPTHNARPLPNPSAFKPATPGAPRSPFARPPPSSPSTPTQSTYKSPLQPRTYTPQESTGFLSSESERLGEDARREASQQKTKAGGFAAKSLLEREMERERQRQQEWEEAQKESASTKRDLSEGVQPGQSWDVNQYGFTGGDNQGRGSGPGSGIGFGGRRQIVGPRPQGPR